MPEHTSFFSYLIAQFPALGENMHRIFGQSVSGKPVTVHQLEPLVASAFVTLLILMLGAVVGGQVRNREKAAVPDANLSLRTFFELFIGYFYDMMKEMMGPKKAKRYFPIVGTCALFIFFSNIMGLIPGLTPPTSTWNITWGCALVVFVAFNFYGLKENGFGYLAHLAGPWLGWAFLPVNLLVLPIEIISTCMRPFTLSIRLMLNMAVDHLLVTLIAAMFAFFLPIPILMLGTIVALVQVLVFCLLTSVYISLATEHDESHGGEAHAH